MENKKLIVCNLKMYMNTIETINYLNTISSSVDNINVVICPSSIYIPYFISTKFSLGIQNIATEDSGAYTGCISALQAKQTGVSYALLGHSERRLYNHETNEDVHVKIHKCLNNSLIPIVCIGETNLEYNNKTTKVVLRKEIIDCFSGLSQEEIEKVIIAYEPIWAIGTGKIPSKEEIKMIVNEIKLIVLDNFHVNNISVLYGGSVTSANIEDLETINNLSGYLIGSAATKSKELLDIIEVVY